MTFTIYVTSKGRPAAPTFVTLDEAHLPYLIVVEPQDVPVYEDAGHELETFLILPENDRGIAYARQFALEHARGRGDEWLWLLDDDISAFHRTNEAERKNERRSAQETLQEAEAWAHEHGDDLGIVALEYQQFAWNATIGKATMNSYTDVAILVRADVFADYREELKLKVDRDFTLQVLASGADTARLRWLSFSTPTNGTNQGGLHDVYEQGVEDSQSKRLAELWPGIVEYKVKPNGRPDAKIHWRRTRSTA